MGRPPEFYYELDETELLSIAVVTAVVQAYNEDVIDRP